MKNEQNTELTSKKNQSSKKKTGISKTLQKTADKKEIKSLKTALTEQEDRYLRLKAEFDNYRKRNEREISRVLKYEGEDVVKAFLPVMDDLDRLLDSTADKKSNNLQAVKEGINLIVEKMHKRLASIGAVPFDSINQKFNHDLHEALMTQESEEHDDQTIIEEFEKGYSFKDKVIRHAKVVVTTNSKS